MSTTAEPAAAIAAAPEPPAEPAAADGSVDAAPCETLVEAAPSQTPIEAPPARELDLVAVAHLCTELARVEGVCDMPPLLAGMATVVEAAGVIVWLWDPQADALAPAVAHGYTEDLLARLPCVKRDEPNVTAAAFRSGEPRAVEGFETASDALVVPLLTPAGCAGVLAIELEHGAAKHASTQAIAAIFAAQIAQLVRPMDPAAQADRRFA